MEKIGKFNISKKYHVLHKTITYSNKKHYDYSKKYSNYKYNLHIKNNQRDFYLDKNAKDTFLIKYKSISEVKETICKLERLFKNGKYSHKRILQIDMMMYIRLRALVGKIKEKTLVKKYINFLRKRVKVKGSNNNNTFILRKNMTFKF